MGQQGIKEHRPLSDSLSHRVMMGKTRFLGNRVQVVDFCSNVVKIANNSISLKEIKDETYDQISNEALFLLFGWRPATSDLD